jgi:hypothetical protein
LIGCFWLRVKLYIFLWLFVSSTNSIPFMYFYSFFLS